MKEPLLSEPKRTIANTEFSNSKTPYSGHNIVMGAYTFFSIGMMHLVLNAVVKIHQNLWSATCCQLLVLLGSQTQVSCIVLSGQCDKRHYSMRRCFKLLIKLQQCSYH